MREARSGRNAGGNAATTDRAAKKPRFRTMPPPPPRVAEHEVLPPLAGEATGLFLWSALRDARMYADTRPDERALFFADNAALAERRALATEETPELAEAVAIFGALRSQAGAVEAAQLADACARIFRWADLLGLSKTALVFAEVAADVEPNKALRANKAGWICRRCALYERAEVWFIIAHRLAARVRDHGQAIKAMIGRGATLKERGRHAEAMEFYEQAAKRSKSTRRRRRAAEARHELMALAAEIGTSVEAAAYLRAALDIYPIHHPFLPALVHDWCFLLVRIGLHARALALVDRLLPLIRHPAIQAVVWSTLARAAAGVRMRKRYEEAERNVLQLIETHTEFASASLVNLAYGARLLGRWRAALQYGVQGERIAAARGEAEVLRAAHQLLAEAAERRGESFPNDRPSEGELDDLDVLMLDALERWKKPKRKNVEVDPETGGRFDHPPA